MTLVAMLTIAVQANAMSFEQARNEALFLTDKMAYELNLTDEQYEAAYEINLDYLMGVTGRADVFGTYWERRNLDLSYILLDWQWQAFIAASYFYRPLYWEAGYWHFGIYARYPHRDYFYFGRPHFYATYRGGHAWHLHSGHGYYYSHRTHFRPAGREHFGMHDRWTRGDFRNGHRSSTRITGRNDGRGSIGNRGTMNNRRIESGRGSMNSRRIESGRGTMNTPRVEGNRGYNYNNNGPEAGSRQGGRSIGNHSSFDRSNRSVDRSSTRSNFGSSSHGSTFGGSRSNSSFGNTRGSSSIGSSRGSSSFGGSRSSSSFGGSRGSSSFGGSSRGGSFGGSRGGGSFGGGSHGGGSHGGGHTGGRR